MLKSFSIYMTTLEKIPVDVIIPFYNRVKYLPELISGLNAQTHQNWRAIVADDCSDPDQFETLKKYESKKVLILRHERNQGPAAARNTAIQHSTAPYLIFNDSDDISLPNRFYALLKKMEKRPSLSILGSRLRPIGNENDAGFNILKNWPHETKVQDIRKSYNQLVHCVCAPSAIYRREVFDTVGLFTPFFRYSEDVDFLIRASRLGLNIANMKKRLYAYRLHEENSKKTTDYQKYIKVLYKMYRTLGK